MESRPIEPGRGRPARWATVLSMALMGLGVVAIVAAVAATLATVLLFGGVIRTFLGIELIVLGVTVMLVGRVPPQGAVLPGGQVPVR